MAPDMVDSAAVQSQYINLIFPTIRELYIQALVLGPFFAGFGILRQAAQSGESPLQSTILQRLLLIGGMIFFTIGVIISYNTWRNTEYIQVEKISGTNIEVFAILTIVMVPIEITAMILISLSFAALSIKTFANYSDIKHNLKYEIGLLTFLIALIYGVYMLWFVPMLIIEGSIGLFFNINNAGYHLIGLIIALSLYVIWQVVVRTRAYRESPVLFDWLFAFIVSGALTANYVIRLYIILTEQS